MKERIRVKELATGQYLVLYDDKQVWISPDRDQVITFLAGWLAACQVLPV